MPVVAVRWSELVHAWLDPDKTIRFPNVAGFAAVANARALKVIVEVSRGRVRDGIERESAMTCQSADPSNGKFRKQFEQPTGEKPVAMNLTAALAPAGRAAWANETSTIGATA